MPCRGLPCRACCLHSASTNDLRCCGCQVLQEHKQVVADALELVEFRAGDRVFGEGEAGDRFYLMREGTGK